MKNKTKAWFMLLGLSLIWGSSFILMEKAMFPKKNIAAFTPYQVGALRMLIACLVLLPFAIRNIKKFKGKNILLFIVVGIAGNFIPSFLFPIAETGIQSSLAGLLNMGTSIFIVIISFLFFKHKISKLQLFGLLIGGLGLFLIVYNQITLAKNNLTYAGFALLATLCYAISLSLIKFKLSHQSPLTITSLAFLSMLPLSIAACFYTDAFNAITIETNHQAIPYLLILAIVGTALAVLVFNYLVAISTPLFASSVTYIIPIVALIFGILDGEQFNLINLLWMLLIFIGVFLMGKSKKR